MLPIDAGSSSREFRFLADVWRHARERHARGHPLRRPSKSIFPALIKSDLPVWETRRFPRQLHDRLPLLAAISEGLQQKAFIAFLHYFDLGWDLRHGNRTKFPGAGSSCAICSCTLCQTQTSTHRLLIRRPRTPCSGGALTFGGRLVTLSAEPAADYGRRDFRIGLAASSIQAGAWSLALGSPRTSRSTPAALNRGAIAGLSNKWSKRSPASRGHRLRK
jgi:hypothetical protein